MKDRTHMTEADLADAAASAAATDAAVATSAVGTEAATLEGGEEGEEIVAALRTVPMLREPRRLPGRKPACFTPEQFFVLSRVPRTDVSLDDDGLWLSEEEAPRISGNGIEFHDQLYWSQDLRPYVGLRARDSRRFVIRYDRALLARGVLDELQVLEVMPDNSRVPRCRVGLKSEEIRAINAASVLLQTERYRRLLQARTTAAHHEVISIEHGRRALEEHVQQERARMRRQRRDKPEPIAAAPMSGAGGEVARTRRAEAERNERLAGHIGSGGSAEAESGRVQEDPQEGPVPIARSEHRGRQRGRVAASPAPAPASTQDAAKETRKAPTDATGALLESETPASSTHPDRARRLADHLGGTLGLATSDDD